MRGFSVVFLQETHLEPDEETSFKAQFEEFWVFFESADSARRGSLIMVSKTLCKEHEVIKVDLRDPCGPGYTCVVNVDTDQYNYTLINIYMDSSCENRRVSQIRNLARNLEGGRQIFALGDYNYVEKELDRVARNPLEGGVGRVNEKENREWTEGMRQQWGLVEEPLDIPTYMGGNWVSRLDRVETNLDAVDLLEVSAEVYLPHIKKWVSDHRPIALSVSKYRKPNPIQRIPDWITAREDWSEIVGNSRTTLRKTPP